MPNRHQPYRPRILKAEIAVAHALFEKSHDLTSYLDHARIRPPRHRQGKIVKVPEIVTVEEAENAGVKIDDLPALPMAPRIVRRRRQVAWDQDLIRHIDAERTEEMGAQRRAAAMHAQNENDRPALHRARNCRDPVAPRRLERKRL